MGCRPNTFPSATHHPNPPTQAIKRRLLLTLTGLAIGFAVLAFAQQKETVDPQLIQKLHDAEHF